MNIQSEKYESLNTLATGLAHELNNLLVAIMGQASVVSRKLPADHVVQRHLERLLAAADRSAVLTNQMLTYSGKHPTSFTTIEIPELLKDCLYRRELFASVDRGETPQVKLNLLSLPELRMPGDYEQLCIVIQQLLQNSIEAKAKNIGITCDYLFYTAESLSPFTYYTGLELTSGDYILISFSDDGVGIATDALGRLFDPFFSTKFDGRGLGLAVVLGIIRAHQGGIAVESDEGSGTTFSLLFPLLP